MKSLPTYSETVLVRWSTAFIISWLGVLATALWLSSCKLPDVLPIPPTTTTTTIPDSEEMHPDMVHTAAGWTKWSDLSQTCVITAYNINQSRFWASYSGYQDWPSADMQTCGFICMTWESGGVVHGEYWDGMARRDDYGYVSFFHITDPTSPFSGRVPVQGQKVGMFFVSEDNSQRSSVAWTTWPLNTAQMYNMRYRTTDGYWKRK
jgi:hypothetical protein